MASIFSGKAGRQAANFVAEQAKKGQEQAFGYLDKGMEGATGLYDLGQGYYQPYADAGGTSLAALTGSLGLGGQAERDAAVGAFQAGPGYQFAQDAAAKAGLRAASAAGNMNSGNTMIALSDRAQGIANQEYSGWQNSLSGLAGMGMQASGAMADNRMNLGNLGMNTAGLKAGIATDTANTVGQAGAGGLMAGQQAAANRFGAVMGGLNTLTGLAGQFAGGGFKFGGA